MLNKIILVFVLLLCTSCSSLRTIGLGAGGAAAGSLVGPAGAAGGAAAGIAAGEIWGANEREQESLNALKEAAKPQSAAEGFVEEVGSLLHTVGWWYLIIFIVIPLLTKKGRTWVANFATLHTTATKKDVNEYGSRLDKLEGMISSLRTHKKL